MSPDDVTWITNQVAITNFFSAHQGEVLAQNRVEAVLCLDQDVQGCSAAERGVKCVRLVHLWDGENEMVVFRDAVTALKELAGAFGRIVVHCRAGRSRSVAVVAAFLTNTHSMSANDALRLVQSKRESAVAPELIRLLDRFAVEPPPPG